MAEDRTHVTSPPPARSTAARISSAAYGAMLRIRAAAALPVAVSHGARRAMEPYAVSGRGPGPSEALAMALCPGDQQCDALAYLWMAMECRQNIILSGAAPAASAMLRALSAFAPACERTVTVSSDLSWGAVCGPKGIFALYGNGPALPSAKRQISRAVSLYPDRIIVYGMHGEGARELFCGANRGISFVASMPADLDGRDVPEALLCGPMRINKDSISVLDAFVRVRDDLSISSISQYMWLSRAEICEGTQIAGADMVSVRNVVGQDACGPLDQCTKAAASYAGIHGISAAHAAAEIKRRSDILRTMMGSVVPDAAVRGYQGW